MIIEWLALPEETTGTAYIPLTAQAGAAPSFYMYKRTVVVSSVGTDLRSGQALLTAVSSITDASATKKYLLYIEPGTYDLGSSGFLVMKQYVDIQGAGELQTTITRGVFSPSGSGCPAGKVKGANNAELGFLVVQNTGTGACNITIRNDSASPRLTHITAKATASGGSDNFGVFNARSSNPTMTDVTVTASGGVRSNAGVYSSDFSPTITSSKLIGTTYSLYQTAGGLGTSSNIKVALAQLERSIRRDAGTLRCFNNYDANLAAVTCP